MKLRKGATQSDEIVRAIGVAVSRPHVVLSSRLLRRCGKAGDEVRALTAGVEKIKVVGARDEGLPALEGLAKTFPELRKLSVEAPCRSADVAALAAISPRLEAFEVALSDGSGSETSVAHAPDPLEWTRLLPYLENCVTLKLDGCGITELPVLAGTKLETLAVRRNGLRSAAKLAAAVSDLRRLRELDASRNDLRSDGWRPLRVARLDLAHNHLCSLAGFEGCEFRTLNISYNKIERLEEVGRLGAIALTSLSLRGNPLKTSRVALLALFERPPGILDGVQVSASEHSDAARFKFCRKNKSFDEDDEEEDPPEEEPVRLVRAGPAEAARVQESLKHTEETPTSILCASLARTIRREQFDSKGSRSEKIPTACVEETVVAVTAQSMWLFYYEPPRRLDLASLVRATIGFKFEWVALDFEEERVCFAPRVRDHTLAIVEAIVPPAKTRRAKHLGLRGDKARSASVEVRNDDSRTLELVTRALLVPNDDDGDVVFYASCLQYWKSKHWEDTAPHRVLIFTNSAFYLCDDPHFCLEGEARDGLFKFVEAVPWRRFRKHIKHAPTVLTLCFLDKTKNAGFLKTYRTWRLRFYDPRAAALALQKIYILSETAASSPTRRRRRR